MWRTDRLRDHSPKSDHTLPLCAASSRRAAIAPSASGRRAMKPSTDSSRSASGTSDSTGTSASSAVAPLSRARMTTCAAASKRLRQKGTESPRTPLLRCAFVYGHIPSTATHSAQTRSGPAAAAVFLLIVAPKMCSADGQQPRPGLNKKKPAPTARRKQKKTLAAACSKHRAMAPLCHNSRLRTVATCRWASRWPKAVCRMHRARVTVGAQSVPCARRPCRTGPHADRAR